MVLWYIITNLLSFFSLLILALISCFVQFYNLAMGLLSLSISSPLTTEKGLINRVGPIVWNNNNTTTTTNNNNNNFSYAIPYNLFKSKQSIILDEVFAEVFVSIIEELN